MKRQILGPVQEGKLSKEQAKKIVQDVIQRLSQHVVPAEQGGWNVKRGGDVKTTKHFDNKKDAIYYARKVSANQNTRLIIHGRDGKIQSSTKPVG